ncbi:hypothetical protein BSKO_08830 [Bryopsis sp. KO-2023]|nr:hypothetical protein BSKO_08830 [Bryopsis sp. KO-2023]
MASSILKRSLAGVRSPCLRKRGLNSVKLLQPNRRTSDLLLRCYKSETDGTENGRNKRKEEIKNDLEKNGVFEKSAQKLISTWSDEGAITPMDIRFWYFRKHSKVIQRALITVALDAAASGIGFVATGAVASTSLTGEPSPFVVVAGVFAVYYAAATLFDVIKLLGVLVSLGRFGADAELVMAAVEELAYPKGKPLTRQELPAVDISRLRHGMDLVASCLKSESACPIDNDWCLGLSETTSGADSLAAFLILSKAQDEGFDPEKYGVSPEVSQRVASAFVQFDKRGKSVLDAMDLTNMFNRINKDMSEDEVQAAVAMLDKEGKGVGFEDLVGWCARTDRIVEEVAKWASNP